MDIKIWGCRGSIPAPIKPADVKQKIKEGIVDCLNTTQGGDDIESQVDNYLATADVAKTFGGNTTCLEVKAKGYNEATIEDKISYMFDCGSGLREAGLDMMSRGNFFGNGKVKVFLSHMHWDHINGFPFFVPAFIPGNKVIVYGSKTHEEALDLALKGQSEEQGIESVLTNGVASGAVDCLAQYALTVQQSAGLFPVKLKEMPSSIQFHYLENEEVVENGVRVESKYFGDRTPEYNFKTGEGLVPRHKEGIFSYKVIEDGKSFVYATDIELDQPTKKGSVDTEYLAWIKGVDVLYADAQYTPEEYNPAEHGKQGMAKIGWGHSTYETIIDYAKEAGVKKLLLGHHEPTRNDKGLIELHKRATEYAKQGGYEGKVEMAFEGMNVTL
ncbi:MAG: MBL fold metallo-hydrolase [Nanoarchaeota archaeon]|nr:MBL fold metallo-hydrolase [Nanoarchaeota archaeon]